MVYLYNAPKSIVENNRLDKVLASTQSQAPAGNMYLALLLFSSVFGKSLNLLQPQFPHEMNTVGTAQVPL